MLPFNPILSFLLGYTLHRSRPWPDLHSCLFSSSEMYHIPRATDSLGSTSTTYAGTSMTATIAPHHGSQEFSPTSRVVIASVSLCLGVAILISKCNRICSEVHYPIFFKFWVFFVIVDVDIDTSIASKILALYSTEMCSLKNPHHLLNSINIWWRILRRSRWITALSRQYDHNIIANHRLPHLRLTTTS